MATWTREFDNICGSAMRAADTNLIVRLLIRDNAKQTKAAEDFIKSGAWVSLVVLAETTWALQSIYDLRAQEIADAIEMLLRHESVAIEQAETVESALRLYQAHPKLGFSDCLILEIARKAGHLPFGTFDRALGKIDGAERIG